MISVGIPEDYRIAGRATVCRTKYVTVSAMSEELNQLIERARRVVMSDADREAQRRSFAYGNIKIENEMVTREIVDQEAEKLAAANG
jgi:hypothetical protein